MAFDRLVIAAPKSGSGKTMFTMGLLCALKKKKQRLCSFKCGPDFIDPMYHSRVLQIPSKNLDTFFTDQETTRKLFCYAAKDADLSVIEGVMGYFDGASMSRQTASTYELADTLDAPCVLVVDAKGMGRSILPLLKGFLDFEERHLISGVILNRVSAGTYEKLKELIEEELGLHVYGYLPVLKEAAIDSRHLGLCMPEELTDLKERLAVLADQILQSVDVDGLIALAGQAAPLSFDSQADFAGLFGLQRISPKKTIAVARDEAFCFLYEDNLNVLRALADVVSFSPLHDERLPEHIDAILLPGGYPENYAKELSENESMKQSILAFAESGGKILAECGGFLYLQKTLTLQDQSSYPMVGLFDGKAYWTGRLSRFGYIELYPARSGDGIRAHEFHYFDTTDNGTDYTAQKPFQNRNWPCIHRTSQLFAGFPHLYYLSSPKVLEQFLKE